MNNKYEEKLLIKIEDFKEEIRKCLREIHHCSIESINKYMNEYKDDFLELLIVFEDPKEISLAMIMGY